MHPHELLVTVTESDGPGTQRVMMLRQLEGNFKLNGASLSFKFVEG
jgi:hypothetical protein